MPFVPLRIGTFVNVPFVPLLSRSHCPIASGELWPAGLTGSEPKSATIPSNGHGMAMHGEGELLMKSAPEARVTAAKLAEKFLTSLGICCLLAETYPTCDGAVTRFSRRPVAARYEDGVKNWFRSAREIEKVEREIIASWRQASRIKDHIVIREGETVAADIVRTAAQLAGVRPIKDEDLATTFESVSGRIDAQLKRMHRDGSMKRINREYQALRQGTKGTLSGDNAMSQALESGTNSVGQSRDNRDIGDKTLPSYGIWLIDRLSRELGSMHQSGALKSQVRYRLSI